MEPVNELFRRCLGKILQEIFDGPVAHASFLLNPGDPGLLKMLDGIDAETASTPSGESKTTVAAHVDHVHYGFTLINRWAAGEANPWTTADWNASWQRGMVNDAQWAALRANLRSQVAAWNNTVATFTSWDEISACGAIATAAHTAYHLGAIRQILAAQGKWKG